MKNLTSGRPLKIILLFAVPLFIGQLFQLFYSLVDTRIVGSTLGEVSLAAVGATTTLSDMLTGLLNGLTNGFAIIIATYFGAKDEKHMKKAIGGTILLGSAFAVVISAGCLLFPRAMSQSHACMTLANAARVNTPSLGALQFSCPAACGGVIDFCRLFCGSLIYLPKYFPRQSHILLLFWQG